MLRSSLTQTAKADAHSKMQKPESVLLPSEVKCSVWCTCSYTSSNNSMLRGHLLWTACARRCTEVRGREWLESSQSMMQGKQPQLQFWFLSRHVVYLFVHTPLTAFCLCFKLGYRVNLDPIKRFCCLCGSKTAQKPERLHGSMHCTLWCVCLRQFIASAKLDLYTDKIGKIVTQKWNYDCLSTLIIACIHVCMWVHAHTCGCGCGCVCRKQENMHTCLHACTWEHKISCMFT